MRVEGVELAYDRHVVARDLGVEIPGGGTTVIVGPNACGKSTLLRAMARLLRPRSGTVLLDGADIHRLPTRQVARRLGLLPQSPTTPDGIRVVDLVARGRSPHQSFLQRWTRGDEEVVTGAMVATRTEDLADRHVDELSGGQRQRVWIAMALAQQTGLLLLDEPTTFLDIAHQIEILDLLAGLNEDGDRTVVMVLHDLNLAGRYADHLIAMQGGAVVAAGSPHAVLDPDTVRTVFGLEAVVIADPVTGTPLVVPYGPTTDDGIPDRRGGTSRPADLLRTDGAVV